MAVRPYNNMRYKARHQNRKEKKMNINRKIDITKLPYKKYYLKPIKSKKPIKNFYIEQKKYNEIKPKLKRVASSQNLFDLINKNNNPKKTIVNKSIVKNYKNKNFFIKIKKLI